MNSEIAKRTPAELVEDVYLTVMVDASGSMRGVAAETIQAYNQFLDDRKDDSAIRYSGVLFNTATQPLTGGTTRNAVRLSQHSYAPDDGTALFDSIVERINAIDALDVAPVEVLFVVFSDGDDTASRANTVESAGDLIRAKAALGWQFVFFAPDESTRATARRLGFRDENIASYAGSAPGIRDAFRRLSRGTKKFIAAAEIGALPPARFFD